MNIIFYRYKSICEPDYIHAFKSLGINVIEDNDGANKNIDITEKISNLGALIAEKKPIFVFSINFFPFISVLCNRIKVKYVAESVDCPLFEIYNNAIKGEYNRIFLFDKKQYESVRTANLAGTFYLPLGAPIERVSEKLQGISGYEYDISFVGSLYKEKDDFLNLHIEEKRKKRIEELIYEQLSDKSYGLDYIEERITPADIEAIKKSDDSFYSNENNIFDTDKFVAINKCISYHSAYIERIKIFNKIASCNKKRMHLFTLSDTSELSKDINIHGGVDSLNEMPIVFRKSKINLNITMRSIQTGIPQRVWDVLSCGGFLITNDQPEIYDYFEMGKHLEVYKDDDELIDKIDFYLKHDDERISIAENGFREVCNKHSVLNRAISIIKAL